VSCASVYEHTHTREITYFMTVNAACDCSVTVQQRWMTDRRTCKLLLLKCTGWLTNYCALFAFNLYAYSPLATASCYYVFNCLTMRCINESATTYTAERNIAKNGISCAHYCWRPFCLSVTDVIHVQTFQHTEMYFTPYNKAMLLVPWCQLRNREFIGLTQTSVLKKRYPLSTAKLTNNLH